MARYNTVLVRGHAEEVCGIATGSVITPGNVVTPSGAAKGWARVGAGAAVEVFAFAKENTMLNGNTIDDNIAQNDSITVLLPSQGAWIYAVTTATIDRGEQVTTAANGAVAVRAAGEPLLGVAMEASDLTDGRVLISIGGNAGTESA